MLHLIGIAFSVTQVAAISYRAIVNTSNANVFVTSSSPKFGYDDGLWNGGPTFADPRYANVLKSIGAQVIRYPGGSPSSYWNWTTGTFCDTSTNALCIDKPSQYVVAPGHEYRLSEVIASLPSIGPEASLVLDLNPVTDSLES